MKVLVLGCGPAGLMAVHAATTAGHDVLIASKKRKSEMFGAQYLHGPIPGIDCGQSQLIKYELRGTEEQYRAKVYGSDYKGTVSPGELEEEHLGWDIRRAYDDLWDLYGSYVMDTNFTRMSLTRFLEGNYLKPDVIISSMPGNVLCKSDQHQFSGETVYAIGDAPERDIFNPISAPPNTVVCNGEPDVGWYRTANVFGYSTTEWPGKRKPPLEGVAQIVKPLKTNCDCWPDVRRVGRFGKWQKGVLSHHAYYETEGFLAQGYVQEGLF